MASGRLNKKCTRAVCENSAARAVFGAAHAAYARSSSGNPDFRRPKTVCRFLRQTVFGYFDRLRICEKIQETDCPLIASMAVKASGRPIELRRVTLFARQRYKYFLVVRTGKVKQYILYIGDDSKIGASRSGLTAMIVPDCRIPAMWCIAPEIPSAI